MGARTPTGAYNIGNKITRLFLSKIVLMCIIIIAVDNSQDMFSQKSFEVCDGLLVIVV